MNMYGYGKETVTIWRTPILHISYTCSVLLFKTICESKAAVENDLKNNVIKVYEFQNHRSRISNHDHWSKLLSSQTVSRTMRWIVHAETEKETNCKYCVRFDLGKFINHDDTLELDLWIYITLSHSFLWIQKLAEVQISLIIGNEQKIDLAQLFINYKKAAWHKIQLKNLIRYMRSSSSIVLQIQCFYCKEINKEFHLPYLSVLGKFRTKRETKRIAKKCRSNRTGCCLDDLVVNFKDIVGPLSKNIIFPKSINIGICRGTCNDPHEVLNIHSAMLNVAKLTNKIERKLCCVPQGYDPLPILMVNGKKDIVTREIDDMVIRECRCS